MRRRRGSATEKKEDDRVFDGDGRSVPRDGRSEARAEGNAEGKAEGNAEGNAEVPTCARDLTRTGGRTEEAILRQREKPKPGRAANRDKGARTNTCYGIRQRQEISERTRGDQSGREVEEERYGYGSP